jgi:hypothetical protein
MALNEAQLAHVRRRLERCPDIRGTVLYRELCQDYGYAGSYPSAMRSMGPLLRAGAEQVAEVRFETDPGRQTQVDWAHIGNRQLGDELVPMYALVAILGASRVPAIRFATDRTRVTTLHAVTSCLDDLGGVTTEILTDRDAAFCVGATGDGHAVLAAEWVDLCDQLGTTPRACRPYRAKTKGKVERMVREVKEDFLPWLSGHLLPLRPALEDYDRLARQWRDEVVLPRRHRTTGLIVRDAWAAERPLLGPLPPGLPRTLPPGRPSAATGIVDLAARRLGDRVEIRDLTEYEVAL